MNIVVYELSLGKCHWSLTTHILLNNSLVSKQLAILLKVPHNHNLYIFYKDYNEKYLTPDGLLYCNPTEYIKLAINQGCIKSIKEGLKIGPIYYRWTPSRKDYEIFMFLAAWGGKIEIVKLMLTYGAKNFDDCMQRAVIVNNREVVDLMISCGATDFNDGLYKAVCHGHADMVDYMIACGATRLNDALFGAKAHDRPDMVSLLTKYGAKEENNDEVILQKLFSMFVKK